MRIGVVVEDIDHRELADGDRHPVGILPAAKLVQVRVDLFGLAAEIVVWRKNTRGSVK
jgi:hypothetical protein